MEEKSFKEYKYKVLDGAEFKKIFGGNIFVKLTNKKETHFGMEYKTGLNEDHLEFNPTGSCSPGGLYFTILHYASHYMNYKMKYYRTVTLLDDSPVYIEDKKFKTKKFILSDKKELSELWNDNDFCLAAVKQDCHALQYVEEQTLELCLAAVQQDGYVLHIVKNQTPEICLAAVQQDGYAVQYVEEQTPEICLAAVQRIGCALQYVKPIFKTPEICLAAVQRIGYVLQYVEEQTPEICLAAVQRDGYAVQYVEEQTPEICLAAVQQDGYALRYVKPIFKTPEICLAAVQQDGFSVTFVESIFRISKL